MKKSSLEIEPPPRFIGEKEVNKKKNSKNLPQLVLSMNKSGHEDKNPSRHMKNNEKRDYNDTNTVGSNYSSLEKYFSEDANISASLKSLEFLKPETTNDHPINKQFDYFNKKEDTTQQRTFYGMPSSYTFPSLTQTKTPAKQDSYKKGSEYSASKEAPERYEKEEKEEKEVIYNSQFFGEDRTKEESTLPASFVVTNQNF